MLHRPVDVCVAKQKGSDFDGIVLIIRDLGHTEYQLEKVINDM